MIFVSFHALRTALHPANLVYGRNLEIASTFLTIDRQAITNAGFYCNFRRWASERTQAIRWEDFEFIRMLSGWMGAIFTRLNFQIGAKIYSQPAIPIYIASNPGSRLDGRQFVSLVLNESKCEKRNGSVEFNGLFLPLLEQTVSRIIYSRSTYEQSHFITHLRRRRLAAINPSWISFLALHFHASPITIHPLK